MKKLVLFTAGFPFGASEPFLTPELNYLTNRFDHIDIIAINPESNEKQEIPQNCVLHVLNHKESPKQKFLALFNIFNPIFWQELFLVKKVYSKKLKSPLIATMLMGLFRAKTVKKFV